MDYKILVIDDDKDLCALVKESVAAEHINADYCYSGTDGLAMLEKSDYQLILLDVMMPGMDGFRTMEKIRQQSSIPILMLTSKNDFGHIILPRAPFRYYLFVKTDWC